jgi:hypothetical protein
VSPDYNPFPDHTAERTAGVFVSDDDKVSEAKEILQDLNYKEDDGN